MAPQTPSPAATHHKSQAKLIIIVHRDRLDRFGYEWFEAISERHGTRIIVINGDKLLPEKEMVEDLLAIGTVFSARFHGLRSYRKVIKDACLKEDQNLRYPIIRSRCSNPGMHARQVQGIVQHALIEAADS